MSAQTRSETHTSDLNLTLRTEQACALNCMIPSASSGMLSSDSSSILPALWSGCLCVCRGVCVSLPVYVCVHLAWLSLRVAGNWTRRNKTRGRPTARRVGLPDRATRRPDHSCAFVFRPLIVPFTQPCFQV